MGMELIFDKLKKKINFNVLVILQHEWQMFKEEGGM